MTVYEDLSKTLREYIEENRGCQSDRLLCLMDAAAEAIDYLYSEYSKDNEWRSVDDEMPRHDGKAVMVWAPQYRNIFLAIWNGKWTEFCTHCGGDFSASHYGPITHWKPLPDNPEVPLEWNTGAAYDPAYD